MRISRSDSGTLCVLSISGMVDAAATEALRTQLVDTLESTSGDLALDMGHVDRFVDSALTALTAARSRAKHLHRRLVVLDRDDGPVVTALRRTGLLYRFPVFLDVAAALEGLEAERATRIGLAFSPVSRNAA